MNITLDIQNKTSPFIREAKIAEWILKVFKFNLLQYVTSRLIKQLDESILLTEGFYKHVSGLTAAEADEMLLLIKQHSAKLDSYDDVLALMKYGNSKEIKEKSKYLLKVVYRLESLLDIQASKDTPVEKTPEYILEGLTNISKASNLLNQE